MSRTLLVALLPWAVALLCCGVTAAAIAWLGAGRSAGGRFRPGRLLRLHADEGGAAQSLSFVLTLPLFVMVILLIVQVSQIMIGTVVVHYAAFAAARSAVVWIPTETLDPEGANRISWYWPDPDAPEQTLPILDPDDPGYGPAEGGMTMIVAPDSPKFRKIASAAVLACAPISPSRDLGLGLSGQGAATGQILQEAYRAAVPEADANPRNAERLENKLAYAASQTRVEIRFFHPNSEPPLVTHLLPEDTGEYYFNELGWQDPITVTVRHNMALLPGPGRLLARSAPRPGAPDRVAQRIEEVDGVYVYPLSASITLGNEGLKSVLPYRYPLAY